MADEKQIWRSQRLRVASYNIAGTKKRPYTIRDFFPWQNSRPNYDVLDGIADFCRQYEIDVIAFQEIERSFHMTGYVSQPKYIQERAGYPYFEYITNFRLGQEYFDHGLCILSRFPTDEPKRMRLYHRDDWFFRVAEYFVGTKKALSTGIRCNDALITLINVHLTDLDALKRAKELTILFEYALEHTPAILLGDFNTPPRGNRRKSVAIQYLNDESLSAIEELSNTNPGVICVNPQLSLFDQASDIDDCHLTYPADQPNVKLDYIFVVNKKTDQIRINIAQTFVPDLQLSDHRPVISDLVIENC